MPTPTPTATPLPTPDAPQNLDDIVVTRNSITITWSKVVGASHYDYRHRVSGSGAWVKADVSVQAGPNDPTHEFRNLLANTKYDLSVRAHGDNKKRRWAWGSWAPHITVTTLPLPTVDRPEGLSSTGTTDTSVSLSWKVVANAHGYKLEYRQGTAGSWSVAVSDTSSTSATATGLTCNTAYQFQVSARGNGTTHSRSFGDASTAVSATTGTCPDAPAPTGLSVTGTTATSVSLGWDTAANVHGYKLEWGSTSKTTSSTSATATGLTCGTAYQFTVKARGDGSPYSTNFKNGASVSATPPCPDAPAPAGLSATGTATTSVSLSWNSVTNTHGYRLEYRQGTTGSWSVAVSDTSSTNGTATGLTCNTAHQFRVSARGDGSPYSTNFGNWSAAVSATTGTCPDASAPGNLRVTATTTTSVRLAWDSVANASLYRLEAATSTTASAATSTGAGASAIWSPGTGLRTLVVPNTRGVMPKLTCGTTYEFRVKARGDGSPLSTTFGSASKTVSATTGPCVTAPSLQIIEVIPGTMSAYVKWTMPSNVVVKTLGIESKRQSGPCAQSVGSCEAKYVVLNTAATTHLVTGLESSSDYAITVKAKLEVGGQKIDVKSGATVAKTHPMPELMVVSMGGEYLDPRIPLGKVEWGMLDYLKFSLQWSTPTSEPPTDIKTTNKSWFQFAVDAPSGTGLQVNEECADEWPTSNWRIFEEDMDFQLAHCGSADGKTPLNLKARKFQNGRYYELGAYVQVLNLSQSWHQADHAVTYYVSGTNGNEIRDMDSSTGLGLFPFKESGEPNNALLLFSNYETSSMAWVNASNAWNSLTTKVTITRESTYSTSTTGVLIRGFWNTDFGHPDRITCSAESAIACVFAYEAHYPHEEDSGQLMLIKDPPTQDINEPIKWTADFQEWFLNQDFRRYLPAALMHEFGHTLGFGHSANYYDIMGRSLKKLRACISLSPTLKIELKLCDFSDTEKRGFKGIYEGHEKH